jgi:hypothetical protein
MANIPNIPKIRTKAEAKAFLRKLYKHPTIVVTDAREIEQLMQMIALMDPIEQTNNQHSSCDVYQIGEVRYEITSFLGDEMAIHKSCTWEEMGL